MIQKSSENKETLRRFLKLPQKLKLLLFVGRLESYKRPFAALELLERLGSSYGLIVIGEGSLGERFQEILLEKGLEKRVFYFSRIPNVQMYQYYAASDYFVNFNTHEIFGMSILEAMYQGCVVIARRAPGPEEIIEDGVSGFLCASDEEMDRAFSDHRVQGMGERAEKESGSALHGMKLREKLKLRYFKRFRKSNRRGENRNENCSCRNGIRRAG